VGPARADGKRHVPEKLRDRLRRRPKGDGKADRRRAPRYAEKRATANIEGVSYPVRNWNHLGFLVAPYVGDQKVGFRIKVRMVIPLGGRPIGISADARVVRIDKRRQELAGEFIDLPAKTRLQLEQMAKTRHARGPTNQAE
jgi:hypothetical protein